MRAKVAVFMGTRPEAIKLAPVVAQLNRSNVLEPLVINSGQHRELIQPVIDHFDIEIAASLDVMVPNQSLSAMTARLIERIDATLADLAPHVVVVQGDTSTVLSAALASFYRRIPIAQVEAGLRTGNINSPFPEEANRRLTTPLVNWHYCPTALAREALLAERVSDSTILVTGNTVVDALLIELNRQASPTVQNALHESLDPLLGKGWQQRKIVLVTGHRRENFGEGFEQICTALQQLAEKFPEILIVFPVHLNPNVRTTVLDRLGNLPSIRLLDPLPYDQFVALAATCRLILTDSGGLQEEAPTLGKPVLVMRESTERREGVDAGVVAIVGADADRIVAAASHLLTDEAAYQKIAQVANPYGDGHAAGRIVDHLASVYDDL